MAPPAFFADLLVLFPVIFRFPIASSKVAAAAVTTGEPKAEVEYRTVAGEERGSPGPCARSLSPMLTWICQNIVQYFLYNHLLGSVENDMENRAEL